MVAIKESNKPMFSHTFRSKLTLACAALALVAAPVLAESEIPEEYSVGGFFIGCQAYTFNRFTAFEAIEKTALAGGRVIEFYPGQKLSKEQSDKTVDHNAPAEVIESLKEKLAKHKLKAVNYGVVGIPKDEAEARKIFEFARTMGMRAVTTESVDAIDTIEKLVKEYDIMVGFHNHPRRADDPNYKVWDPKYILSIIEDRDERVGAAADTGHWLRSKLNPVECLQILEGRIISSHLKDLHEAGPRGHDVPFGTGVANIAEILEELREQDFKGNISIEYEYNWENSTPEVAQCIGFVRGYGTAQGWCSED